VSGYALADFEGQIYLFGGWDGEKVLHTSLRYDPQDDQWDEVTPMPTARAYAGAAEAGGKIYVIGGWDGEFELHLTETFLPERDRIGESSWEEEVPTPEDIHNIQPQSIADLIFAIGQKDHRKIVIVQLNTQTKSWVELDEYDVFIIIDMLNLTTQEGYLYYLGGFDDKGDLLSTNMRFKVVYTMNVPNVTR
jgi:N-acetylneuraminic acid mutarotase